MPFKVNDIIKIRRTAGQIHMAKIIRITEQTIEVEWNGTCGPEVRCYKKTDLEKLNTDGNNKIPPDESKLACLCSAVKEIAKYLIEIQKQMDRIQKQMDRIQNQVTKLQAGSSSASATSSATESNLQ